MTVALPPGIERVLFTGEQIAEQVEGPRDPRHSCGGCAEFLAKTVIYWLK
jgi:hypothetical protein